MKVLLTGQVGLDKGEYISIVCDILASLGKRCKHKSIGKEIIKRKSGADETTILNLPLGELKSLRELAWKEVIDDSETVEEDDIYIANAHAVFRWKHGLFPAIELRTIQRFNPDIIITLIDDIDCVLERLINRGTSFFELWELLAWREEEIHFSKFLCESLAELSKSKIPFFIIPLSQGEELLARLLNKPNTPKVYLSFSVTGLEEKKEVMRFKKEISDVYIAFDPLAITERSILTQASSLDNEINDFFEPLRVEVARSLEKNNHNADNLWNVYWDEFSALGLSKLKVGNHMLLGREINSIRKAIDSQIISRDYLLIEQSDFVIMHISSFDVGKPRISAGSQSEMIYAYYLGKPVYGVCDEGKDSLSPWVTQFSAIFDTLPDAIDYLVKTHPI